MASVPPDLATSAPCPVAFIAEAPGEEEIREGRPLVGPSGKLFNQLLGIAGVPREACWVGNVFREKIPGNDFAKLTISAKDHAKAVKAGLARDHLPPCIVSGKAKRYLAPDHYPSIDLLWADLLAARPRVLVPLGGSALWAVTGATGIDNWRGTYTRRELAWGDVTIIPTLHPARVLRAWKLLTTVAADIEKAWKEANSDAPTPILKASPPFPVTLEDINDFEVLARTAASLAVDIETAAGQITAVGFATDGGHTISVPFVGPPPTNSYWETPADERAAWEIVRQICGMAVPKVLQNGLYDLYWLWRAAGIRVRHYTHDTRLIHHALYPELPKSLGFMGATYLATGPWKNRRAELEKRDA